MAITITSKATEVVSEPGSSMGVVTNVYNDIRIVMNGFKPAWNPHAMYRMLKAFQ